jgi:hypothetical protein
MNAAVPAAIPGSEFDEFLYTPIAEERNGTLLNMVSALARRNVDPWEEAARLAQLPGEAAKAFLTALLVAQPDGPSARADPEALATRLAALLPKKVAVRERSPNAKPVAGFAANPQGLRRSVLLSFVLTALILLMQWFLGHPAQRTAPPGTAVSPTVGATLPKVPAPTPAPAPAPAAAAPRN